MDLTRRDLFRLGAGGAVLWAAGVELRGAGQSRPARAIPIGVQLYSVREECAKDLPGTLKSLAAMGYQGVEFAGYHGRKADELRKMLADLELRCCGTHVGIEAVEGDELKRTVEFNQALGNTFLIVASLPPARMGSVAGLKDAARVLSEASRKVRPQGLRVGYHAHGGDFQPVEGQTPWDVIFSNAAPEVVMQLDTGNCLGGGGDPVAVLRKYPGRAATIHLKEHGGKAGAVIGEGTVPWKDVLALCRDQGTEWFIVEQESYAEPHIESVRHCR